MFVCALIAVSQADVSVAPGYPIGHTGLSTPAITSQQSNILRSYGNLGQVSTFSKTIDTPYSSVSKSDVRVSNPGYATVAHAGYPYAHAAYPAAPVVAHAGYPYAAHAGYPYAAHAGYPYAARAAYPAVAHPGFGGPVVAKGEYKGTTLRELF